MDNGRGGDFKSLIGSSVNSLETTFTIAQDVNKGGMYRFRYRSRNINGWSDWSDITYIKAATIATRPPAPQFKTADSTSLTLSLF
jgi:hypothetical protein